MTQSREREAACSCGQLKMRLAGDPERVSSCHCLACQRRTGALFGSTSFWRKSQIVSAEGERRTFRRQADSGTWLTFQFCPTCGSTVFWESERLPDLVSVAVGSFADPHFPAPVRTVWTESKHDWLAFPLAIPHYPQNPG
jgi:hypothetical protein